MRMWLLVAIAGTALLAAPAATAQQYGGSSGGLSVSDASVDPGDSVTVSGSGFAPRSAVTVSLEPPGRVLAQANADGSGSLSTTVDIPGDVTDGSYTLEAAGVTADGATRVLATEITVGDSSGLPHTGAPLVGIIVAGVALLGAGALLVRRTYRSRGA